MTRETIINSLADAFKNNHLVHAFWLEGADAHNRVDEYSDIDIWFDVEDTKEGEIFNEIEIVLSKLGTIDFTYEQNHSHNKIRQKFFHLKDTSEYLIIDTCVQSHSRVFWYTEGYKDEQVKIIFDKTNVVNFRPFDEQKFNEELSIKIEDVSKKFIFFQAWVKKSLHRNNFLEALGSYHEKVLEPLVELFRLKFEPTKSGFYLKDISKDIPEKYLNELEDLYKINSIDDIEIKYQKATKLFFAILEMTKK